MRLLILVVLLAGVSPGLLNSVSLGLQPPPEKMVGVGARGV